MPAPAPFPTPFPALYLYPLNDSFIPKHISLINNQRVKIGRQTNAKTTPGERNGYFDSKVLSRQHAEVWEEGNKIFIKDVKSSNGTFINGDRLSPEGLESDPYELKSDDIVEFGIDIVGEDNKTIVHHKVAARVMCIFSEQDAQMAARAEQHQMQHLQQYTGPSSMSPATGNGSMMNQAGPSSGVGPTSSAFSFAGQPAPRRMPQQGISGMGGMGGSMRPPGKGGLTFDHILNRLQGELQKSRETGADLHNLTGAMNDIHDTLGGGNLPSNAPPYHTLPPVRPPQPSQSAQSSPPAQHVAPAAASLPHTDPDPSTSSASASESIPASNTASNGSVTVSPPSPLLTDLQNQLKETQESLSLHIDKIRALEGALKEQEVMRHEVHVLREMMDVVQHRENELARESAERKPRRFSALEPRGGFDIDEEDDPEMTEDEFDDDRRSVATVIPHELERVDEEDEEQAFSIDEEASCGRVDELDMELVGEERREIPSEVREVDFEQDRESEQEGQRQRSEEHPRPRTPEPSNLGMSNRDRSSEVYESRIRSKTLTAPPSKTTLSSQSSTVNVVVDELTMRLATLSTQLESALELSSTLQAQHSAAQFTISALENKVEALENLVKDTLTAQQQQQQPASPLAPEHPEKPVSSDPERESLTGMIMEWKKSVEGQWSSVQEEWNQERERLSRAREEWESKVRMVDSGLEQMERMQKVVLTKDATHLNGNGDANYHNHGVGLVTPPSPRSISSDSIRSRKRRSGSGRGRAGNRRRSLSRGADTDDTEATLASDDPHPFDKFSSKPVAPYVEKDQDHSGARSLATPEPSIHAASASSGTSDRLLSSGAGSPATKGYGGLYDDPRTRVNIQAAVGVLILGVAAAAVVWRVKPE